MIRNNREGLFGREIYKNWIFVKKKKIASSWRQSGAIIILNVVIKERLRKENKKERIAEP